MKVPRILLFLIPLILLVGILYAIPQDGVTINTPDDDTWWNLGNYTPGFNFSWSDPENDYNATCNLHIGTINNAPLIISSVNASYGELMAEEYVNYTIYMNHTLPANNTNFYWIIRCGNESFLPWINTNPRLFKQDASYPTFNVSNYSFTNNTWTTNGTVFFEAYILDLFAQGEDLNFSIRNTSNYLYGSMSIANVTYKNLTISFEDGNYTLVANASDPAGNSNTTTMSEVGSSQSWTLFIDSIAPVVTNIAPANGSLVASSENITWLWINWTINETHINSDSIFLEFNGTNQSINLGTNCSVANITQTCSFNRSTGPQRNLEYRIWANDSAGNYGVSSTQIISIDQEGPTITTFNWTIYNGTAEYRILATDSNPSVCSVRLFDREDNFTTKLSGTFGDIGGTTNCTGIIEGSDIGVEGEFTAEFNITDAVGNVNLTNLTGVYNAIYGGWNLITYPTYNKSVASVIGEILNATIISVYNNSGGTFVTYTASTPGTNNNTDITAGDPIFVYTPVNTSIVVYDHMPKESSEEIILTTVFDKGWNTIGLFYDGNIESVYNATTHATLSHNITHASWYNASNRKFYTCKRTGICAGTSMTATNIDLPVGRAVWMLGQTGGNFSINRSEMQE